MHASIVMSMCNYGDAQCNDAAELVPVHVSATTDPTQVTPLWPVLLLGIPRCTAMISSMICRTGLCIILFTSNFTLPFDKMSILLAVPSGHRYVLLLIRQTYRMCMQHAKGVTSSTQQSSRVGKSDDTFIVPPNSMQVCKNSPCSAGLLCIKP